MQKPHIDSSGTFAVAAVIVGLYGGKLYSLSNRILNNREDAEESVSDTYMETWKSIPPKQPTYFYAFLASICRNLSLNRLDWRMAAKRNAEVVALTQEMESCIPDRRQDSEMDRRELRRILERFLESLSKESRLIFLRRYLYVDSVAEIAQRYGISESTGIWIPRRILRSGSDSPKARLQPCFTESAESCASGWRRRDCNDCHGFAGGHWFH